MFIIMHSNYVAACFAEKTDAEAFMETTGKRKKVLSVRELPVAYPFYIAEYTERTVGGTEGSRFLPVPNDEFLRFIFDGLVESEPMSDFFLEDGTVGEHVYLNVYLFDADFKGDPQEPGKDNMGRLNHDHIDNSSLIRYASQKGERKVWDIDESPNERIEHLKHDVCRLTQGVQEAWSILNDWDFGRRGEGLDEDTKRWVDTWKGEVGHED